MYNIMKFNIFIWDLIVIAVLYLVYDLKFTDMYDLTLVDVLRILINV